MTPDAAASSASSPPAASLRPAGRQAITDLFTQMIDDGLHPGAQLAVFRGSDCVLRLAGGRMWPDGPAVTDSTLFQMRSITKLLATLVTLQSLDRGRFALQDHVAQYWPGFAANGKQDITIAHILSHRSGIPDGPPVPLDQLQDRAAVRRSIEGLAPVWVPGTKNGYHAHTIGWVLQELVATWEGRPLHELLQDNVLAPLGLRDLFLGLPADQYERMAHMTVTGAVVESTPRRSAMSDFVNSRAGSRLPISSIMGMATAHDLAALMVLLLHHGVHDGRTIVSADSLRRAAQPSNPPGIPDERLTHPIRWGLGFILGDTPDIYGSVPRPASIGHAGGGANVAWADPVNNLAVTFLCNRMLEREESWIRFRRIADSVYAALD